MSAFPSQLMSLLIFNFSNCARPQIQLCWSPQTRPLANKTHFDSLTRPRPLLVLESFQGLAHFFAASVVAVQSSTELPLSIHVVDNTVNTVLCKCWVWFEIASSAPLTAFIASLNFVFVHTSTDRTQFTPPMALCLNVSHCQKTLSEGKMAHDSDCS